MPGAPTVPPRPPGPPSKPATPEGTAPKNRPQQTAQASDSGPERQYLAKHRKARTLMAVVLKTGAVLRGRITWVDTQSIKLEREPVEPNVLVFKTSIDYLYRADKAGDQDEGVRA